MARRTFSINRPDTLTQTFFIRQLFSCSRTADHTFGKFDLRPVEQPARSWSKRRFSGTTKRRRGIASELLAFPSKHDQLNIKVSMSALA
jgi:hypothetical protein